MMPAPETATQLQKFLRLVTYLPPFIPSLSSFTAPLCGLLIERNIIHLEQLLSGSIWQSQINGLQGYHTAILWHPQACHCPSWCIPKMPMSWHPPRWLPSCLCFQSSYTCEAVLCQHRIWTAHLCFQGRMIPHLCLQLCLHNWEWAQAPWTDQYQESGSYTSPSTENAASTPKLWCHHQVLTWKRDAGCRCPLLLCTLKAPKIPLDITIYHVHITPNRKAEFKAVIQDDLLFCSLAEMIITG